MENLWEVWKIFGKHEKSMKKKRKTWKKLWTTYGKYGTSMVKNL